ncbi:MAG: beta-lactamase domain protein [Solirubrobacterales bacterium]|jgi:glyoxylase-like metal-dependent hydrolase (beta-lactamase superfamily II)|nr:beta-lactamase domain protein [Solirubrobacterales bacterium]
MRVRADTKRLTGPLSGGREGATVAVEPLLCGHMRAPRAFVETAEPLALPRMLGIGTPRSQWLKLPIPAFLIHHPSAGPFLVDTGLHPSVASRPAENMGRLVANFARPTLEPGKDLPSQLRGRGVDPKSIGLVVMTHLHFDHASAMSEFPGATFLLTEAEWIAATTDGRPFLRGYRPVHYDYAFEYRTLSYDSARVSSYSSFGRTFDLFGDGSVRLASTPGHSAGHQSVICRLRDRDLVIAGDAIYTIGQLDDAPEPPRPLDRHTWRRSVQELRLFAGHYPQAVIIPGHDPEHWETLETRYE